MLVARGTALKLSPMLPSSSWPKTLELVSLGLADEPVGALAGVALPWTVRVANVVFTPVCAANSKC